MKKMILKASCLCLAALMTFSLVGCKKSDSGNSSSDDVEIEYVYEYVNGSSGSAESGTSSGSSSDSSVTSSGSNQGTSKPSGTSSGSKSAYDGIEKYRGTTVRYVTWKDPALNEDGPVVKAFEKKYGIKVQVDLIGQDVYASTITGWIASGNSPDVYFCNEDFPYCLSCLQPIDAAQLNLNDSIWDQGMLEVSKINGKSYLVNTVGNIWNEADMVFYNKKLLNDNNITTPEEYYKAGKWNFDALKKVMTDVKGLGSGYVGGYIDFESLSNSTGSSYYKWNNGKFSNGIDTMLNNVTRFMAECYKEGLVRGYDNFDYRDQFTKGTVGIAITNAFGLKKTGYWKDMNTDNIGFTFMPDYDDTHKAKLGGIYRGWGIIKGSKNPVAAGYFLRYYLDVNNYNTKDSFISSEAESFFFKLTNGLDSTSKAYTFIVGCVPITATTRRTLALPTMKDPAQVATSISELQNTINSDVSKLNSFISKQTG